MSEAPAAVIAWFRDDLRLTDHPALTAAAHTGRPIVCLFVHDEVSAGMRPLGGAARWWLAQSLAALDGELRHHGVRLVLRRGAAADVVPAVAQEAGVAAVHWNRRYDGAGLAVDAAVRERLAGLGVTTHTHHANLLFEPDQLRTQGGRPFTVFTPFWRQARRMAEPRAPLPAPARIPAPPPVASDRLDDWGLHRTPPDWAGGLRATWRPGEAGARAQAAAFIDGWLAGYVQRRDRPDLDATSRLSPHLRFGEISPFQVWHAVRAPAAGGAAPGDVDKFLAELGWREFAHHLLHQFPALAERNFQARFDAFPWDRAPAALRAWQRGRTGYPFVDAGMRQLWATGWMHNRVRMVAASFLVKQLMVDWRCGEAWFWDTLVDADPASNAASWQWVAGSGADAAPYFRIFNPLLQARKFDPDGAYVRRWVEELRDLSGDAVHAPWAAGSTPAGRAADYPQRIVDLDVARQRALAAYATLREPKR